MSSMIRMITTRSSKTKDAALVEFIDHEAVELFGGSQLFLDKIFVVGDADSRGGELVEAGREHVAKEPSSCARLDSRGRVPTSAASASQTYPGLVGFGKRGGGG